MTLSLIGLAILPTVVLIIMLLFFDRYEKEPTALLVKVFVFGILSTIPTIIAETVGGYLNFFQGIFGTAIRAFIVVALSEEYFKRRVVLKQAYHHPAFDEKLDGIIYCSFASLGFATAENIMYVLSFAAQDSSLWITRALLSVPAHMLLGITMGYYLSMAKFCMDPLKCKSYMRKSLVVPVILHGIFDFLLMSEMPLLLLFFIPFVIYLWLSSFKKLNQYYKESKLMHS
jgi:protease PrsW